MAAVCVQVLEDCCQAEPAAQLLAGIPGGSPLAAPPLQAAWRAYNELLATHPLPTKLATGAVAAVAGDAVAQAAEAARQQRGSGRPGGAHSRTHSSAGSSSNACSSMAEAAWLGLLRGYDVPRTARLVVYGLLLGTPLGHYWYQYLEQAVAPDSPTSPSAVAIKVGLAAACPHVCVRGGLLCACLC